MTDPLNCIALLEKFEEKQKLEKQKYKEASGLFVGRMLPIELGNDHIRKDVYNPSGPFLLGGRTFICGRVEYPETCRGSQVLLFEEGADRVWRPASDSPILPLEDGFATRFNENETVVGGVKAYPNPTEEHPDRIDYHTVFYFGCEPKSLQEFARGPDRMKDIRLIHLPNGRIVAFTRSFGKQSDGTDYGRGVIACIELADRKDINPENLLRARVIENQFAKGDWGGANELYLLPDGRIGVLGHIAYMDEECNRHYYAMSFIYDSKTHLATPIEIIARRADFPPSGAKTPDTRDVAFSGGMVRHANGMATIYTGLSDMKSGCMDIIDPFWGASCPIVAD